MRKITKRRIIGAVIDVAMFLSLVAAGAGWWALLTVPYALWNYYDGLTRMSLEE